MKNIKSTINNSKIAEKTTKTNSNINTMNPTKRKNGSMPNKSNSQQGSKKPKVVQAVILMAIFKSTAFSKLRKSFGNLTTCQSRGINIVKEKVTEVHNPRTLKQRMQRTKFPLLVRLAEAFVQAISIGFPSKAQAHSAENHFVELNAASVTVNEELETTIDYPNICIAQGNRALPSNITATLDTESGTVTVSVETEEFISHSAQDDEFYCCILEQSSLNTKFAMIGTRAELSTADIQLPANWNKTASNLAVYLFCTDSEKKHASKSVYLPLA